MKREDRASNPAPAVTSSRSESSHACARVGCEKAVEKEARKFCSVQRSGIAHRKPVDYGPISAELLAEMQAALDALRAHDQATTT